MLDAAVKALQQNPFAADCVSILWALDTGWRLGLIVVPAVGLAPSALAGLRFVRRRLGRSHAGSVSLNAHILADRCR